MAQESQSSSPDTQSSTKMPARSSTAKDAQLSALHARQTALETTISELLSQRSSLVNSVSPASAFQNSDPEHPDTARTKVALDDANSKIKSHITQLQHYNDIKDIGTQLMGLIAEKRGCRIAEVQEEFGINPED